MQIRLTVLGPLSGRTPQTAQSAQGEPPLPPSRSSCDVLVTAPTGTALASVVSGLATAVGGPEGPVVVYAGSERLDAKERTLGEPPLLDGSVLALGGPAEPAPSAEGAAARLHVIAGPDAGGVHLLHGGQVSIGRSADADVPLDDPDVSRLHCAVTVAPDGRVTVTDLNSTNGTAVDGEPVADRPVRLAPGALLRIGESALRLAPPRAETALDTQADGEGHIRVGVPAIAAVGLSATAPGAPAGATVSGLGDAGPGVAPHAGPVAESDPRAAAQEGTASSYTDPSYTEPSYTEPSAGASYASAGPSYEGTPSAGPYEGAEDDGRTPERGRTGTPARGTTVPRQIRRRGGIGAWARRLTGGRGEQELPLAPAVTARVTVTEPPAAPEVWPDPSALLLTALGPGPRLWERGPAHPEALAVRLGTADRATPDGAGLLPAVPVTVGLREAGALGLAGPRDRLAGLARAVLAQLAALHSPSDLELVLISTDRVRPVEERTAQWGWLGWLPHVRPAHGQDCRLLLAYDREQAAARTGELLRRLDDHLEDVETPPARGPFTVLVVDGDPGHAGLREATTRLAAEGPAAGIHVICLAETPAASPASPVATTYETACAASPAFRACGAVTLLSGDVATALRLLRISQGRPVGHGQVASVDAVSAAWAERFARALAPLRTADSLTPGERHARVAAPLPQAARLLDELGLARATPASLLARWAAAADDKEALGGRAWAVLGAGPRGPVCADLVAAGPHLLIEGPAGSGRTELLRSAAASLASAERPDRLGMILIDGAGGERGEGLRAGTELPHVTTHLTANDPVRMREFAQALTAELKRRAELLGRLDFTAWHTQREVSGRMVAQRSGAGAPGRPEQRGAADLDAPPSSTLKLRTTQASSAPEPGPPLPRLVVLVDDIDALVAPALGAPGRPSAGSVVRALEAIARDGERLGVHLVATTGRPDRTAETELARSATLRVVLAAPASNPEDPAPGRGQLHTADGRATPFQAGRVTGRIPRTSTLRPTAVPLEWERMGDPPTRRPVRELGNGPTDLALLASALERAARSVAAQEVPSLL
ncbi:FHA domain-containing protein [Streptomyces sp. NBC_01304]|uniref:FHA domain-containing protein n=1 Tax=Streptomyces sp. NBC_01304 TaxID=2903818 RepID=UPI002E1523E2|nr:FtsK/SpoIIIE domain-containing protein [Streptomyces sp. NBC_01304]